MVSEATLFSRSIIFSRAAVESGDSIRSQIGKDLHLPRLTIVRGTRRQEIRVHRDGVEIGTERQ